MKHSRLIGSLGAMLSIFAAMPAHADLIGVLPATPGGTDWQAYYDDQLDITWMANANVNVTNNIWDNQVAWVAGLDINGVTGWRLPNMDINSDGVIVSCTLDQAACKDNEYGHLFFYGAGTTFGSGITSGSPGPFSNVQFASYWSGTEYAPNPTSAWYFGFYGGGIQSFADKNGNAFAWAVHTGDVGGVPMTSEELIANVVSMVIELNLQQGISNALDRKLDNVLNVLEEVNTNNDASAINTLYAFIYSVEAQRGNKISDADADDLIVAAQAIIDRLTE